MQHKQNILCMASRAKLGNPVLLSLKQSTSPCRSDEGSPESQNSSGPPHCNNQVLTWCYSHLGHRSDFKQGLVDAIYLELLAFRKARTQQKQILGDRRAKTECSPPPVLLGGPFPSQRGSIAKLIPSSFASVRQQYILPPIHHASPCPRRQSSIPTHFHHCFHPGMS